jgi:hypothetical protein
MRRDRVQTSASTASRLALTAFVAAAVGCAAGSTTSETDLASAPVVALSDPGAPLPELGHGDTSANTDTLAQPLPLANPLGAGAGSNYAAHPSLGAPFAITSCKKDAFCEDFEEPLPAKRWTSILGGGVDFPAPSSSLGAHALRASTQGGGAAAYLTRAGERVGTQWVGALELSLRVEALPLTTLGGPELAVTDAAGATTRIGFTVRPDGIFLHQRFESCQGGPCTSRTDLVSDVKAGEWRHLVVAVETYGTTAPPFGRIEVIVDGGELLVLPLTVTPFDGQVEARAGITFADSAPATARVDDVTFYAHSPHSAHSL